MNRICKVREGYIKTKINLKLQHIQKLISKMKEERRKGKVMALTSHKAQAGTRKVTLVPPQAKSEEEKGRKEDKTVRVYSRRDSFLSQ